MVLINPEADPRGFSQHQSLLRGQQNTQTLQPETTDLSTMRRGQYYRVSDSCCPPQLCLGLPHPLSTHLTPQRSLRDTEPTLLPIAVLSASSQHWLLSVASQRDKLRNRRIPYLPSSNPMSTAQGLWALLAGTSSQCQGLNDTKGRNDGAPGRIPGGSQPRA